MCVGVGCVLGVCVWVSCEGEGEEWRSEGLKENKNPTLDVGNELHMRYK